MTTTQPQSLAGRVALITGGGTGVGLMIAQAFATTGAKVYITGRRVEVLQKAAASVLASGSIVVIKMDAADEESVLSVASLIQEKDGKLDILVNNAGVTGPVTDDGKFIEKKMAASDTYEPEAMSAWLDIFKINTIAPFFIIRAFTDLFTKGARARGERATSSVINISSAASAIRSTPRTNSIAYATTKAALDQLTISIATHFATAGIPIRVNAIQPGAFMPELAAEVPGLQESIGTSPFPGLVAVTPAKRFGLSDEMGSTAVYLAANEYTNGTILKVDGGVSLVNP